MMRQFHNQPDSFVVPPLGGMKQSKREFLLDSDATPASRLKAGLRTEAMPLMIGGMASAIFNSSFDETRLLLRRRRSAHLVKRRQTLAHSLAFGPVRGASQEVVHGGLIL